MLLGKKHLLPGIGLLVFALGSVDARTYQLKKVMVINENGSGGYAHTTQINFTSNYIRSYLRNSDLTGT